MFEELELPYVPQSSTDGPQNRFSANRPSLHKGSSSKSSQATTNKDNSSINEDEGFSSSDNSAGARDEALAVNARIGDDGSVRVEENIAEDEAILLGDRAELLQSGAQKLDRNARNVQGNLVGAGGNQHFKDVTIETLSDEVVADAFDFATFTVEEGLRVGSEGIDDAYKNAERSQEAANQLSRTTNEIIAGIARERTEDSASEIFKDLQRNLLIGGAILAAVILLPRLKNK